MSSGPFLTQEDKTNIARVLLKNLLQSPEAANGVNVKTLLIIGRDQGLNKRAMKDARKELGIISEDRNGIQYWFMPKEGGAA